MALAQLTAGSSHSLEIHAPGGCFEGSIYPLQAVGTTSFNQPKAMSSGSLALNKGFQVLPYIPGEKFPFQSGIQDDKLEHVNIY